MVYGNGFARAVRYATERHLLCVELEESTLEQEEPEPAEGSRSRQPYIVISQTQDKELLLFQGSAIRNSTNQHSLTTKAYGVTLRTSLIGLNSCWLASITT